MISKLNIHDYYHRTLLKTSNYLYISPNELLKPYISNYTLAFPNKSLISENYTLIPDASSTLVFSFDGNKMKNELWGVTTKINVIGNEANRFLLLLLIEFQPYGLRHFIGINQSELTDLRLPLESVDAILYKAIYDVLEQSKSVYELVTELDCIFLSCLDEIRLSSVLPIAVERIVNTMGNVSVKELSSTVFYSERHLNRIFGQYIGINVKSFIRLVRINNAIRLLKSSQNSIAQVAQKTGFYDQAHFVNDFKSICNITPQAYLKNMSDFYNENFKL